MPATLEQAGERRHSGAANGDQVDVERAECHGGKGGSAFAAKGAQYNIRGFTERTTLMQIRTLILPMLLVGIALMPIPVGADQAGNSAAPQALAVEPVVDFGVVMKGEPINHSFVIRNEGTAALSITEVKPACGCTVADFDSVIESGASGEVRARLDTTKFKGPLAKAIQVFTNDPANPRLTLVIKANIKTVVEARPGYARFVTVYGEDQPTLSQTVWAPGREDFAISRIESPYPFLTVSFHEGGDDDEEDQTAADGKEWRVDMTLDSNAPPGPMADFVLVHTNLRDQKIFRIPVSGFVRPVLSVTPRIADFGRLEITEPQVASLEIRNLGAAQVTLSDISSSLEGLATEVEEIEAGKIYKVILTLNPGLPKGPFEGLLTIDTTSSRQPTIEVNVRGVAL